MKQQQTVEHVFRHEYGKLVALLTRAIGIQHFDHIEYAVQWSMAQALVFWRKGGIPKLPTAWLYRVAYRHLLSELKQSQQRNALLIDHTLIQTNEEYAQEDTLSGELNDSMLKMLFLTCHDDIPLESQLVFTLKSLCGFSVQEIALRLFISEANVYKRFTRAKKYLKARTIELDSLLEQDFFARLPSVHRVLYLVFTEGYLSSHADIAIRRDLCEEAIRLTTLLAENKMGNVPNTYALLALMYFHIARIDARQDDFGALLLLEQQDRTQWNNQDIILAMTLLAESSQGENISRYHVEAGIAAQHCLSPSFEETNWQDIVASYQLLNEISPSPLNLLNKAIATAEWKDPQAGLAVLKLVDGPDWLDHSYYWYTVHADLYFRCGDKVKGFEYFQLAINSAPSDKIKGLLHQRLISRKYSP